MHRFRQICRVAKSRGMVGICRSRSPLLVSTASNPTLQVVEFWTTTKCLAGNPRNTRRKILKPIQFKKSAKMLQDVVSIRASMTVQEVATSIGKDVDMVFEAMSYIRGTEKYDKPDSVIDDLAIIKQILDKTGFRWKMEAKKTEEKEEDKDVYRRPPANSSVTVKRPPVVAIMGHVDHGKTTLLDSLRSTNVVSQEFGGITQHIGAFSVKLSSGETITFLDTPGHAAFSAMRARGAKVTDIVVLVVAADDGVMKQTTESIKYANEAGVPIIVAINKIDKPDCDVEATKKDLLNNGIQLEDFGGEIQAVPISALKGTNLDALQEAIVALAEVLDVKADPEGLVEAVVIESKTDPGRGKLSTALIQRGTLKKGCILVAGTAWAKVRGMFNDQGRPVTKASPGMPVEIIGWRELPSAGEAIVEVESEQKAKEVSSWRLQRQKEERIIQDQVVIQKKMEEHKAEYNELRKQKLEKGHRGSALYREIRSKESVGVRTGPEFSVVVKGDVDGSVEAILDILETYDSSQCQLNLLSYGVGIVTEQDVEMAAIFKGIVYGFNVQVPSKVAQLAKSKGVIIKSHNVIYKLIDDIKKQLTERLPPLQVEETIGEANVLAEFSVTEGKRKVCVAGCRCIKGSLQKKKLFKLVRNGEVLAEGQLMSLKHFKNEVESIKTGVECGLSFQDQTVVPQAGDTVVCFEHKDKKQELSWNLDFL